MTLTNLEAITELGIQRGHLITDRDREFASSLVDQYQRRGTLSEKQWPYVHQLCDRIANPKKPERVAIDIGDVTGIIDLFDIAQSSGLKYPKVRWLPEAGVDVLVLSLAGERSKNPGTINVQTEGGYGSNTWYGRISRDGVFTPSQQAKELPELAQWLTELSADPAAVASAHGHLTGNCCFCTKTLTDHRSTEMGYGPVCAQKWGLPWGA